MNKIGLIFRREYITRVRNKTFLLSTFLLPIVMILFIFGSAYFAMSSKGSLKKIAVVNDPGMFKANLKSDSVRVLFDFTSNVDSSNFEKKGYDAVLNLNNDSVGRKFTIHSKNNWAWMVRKPSRTGLTGLTKKPVTKERHRKRNIGQHQ